MRRRADVRLLGNHLLARIPEMRDWTIALNPFDPRSSANRSGLRSARAWLRRGGLLVVFPAGEVSSVTRRDGTLVDREWQQGVLRLARWSGASIVPAAIGAQSSRWFRLAGLIHPRLRTALLPRELLRLRNQRVSLRFSAAIGHERLSTIRGAAGQLAYLRARSDALEPAERAGRAGPPSPIAPAVDRGALLQDICVVAPHHELLRSGCYSVFCAPALMMPAVLHEIGRLRELAFRAAGEGTGRAIDLDRFDRSYQHLFVWNHERAEVVGAYRVAATDRVCATRGVKALYTSTLFRMAPGFPEAVGPALELGRSFVRTEYQRESNALLLLWKGIGALVAREPRYRRLFGPVSISADYSRPSRQLIARFLTSAGNVPALRNYVRPLRPIPNDGEIGRGLLAEPTTLDQVESLVREFEQGRGMPVLVRQYLKLGARVMGFSLDPAFGNCVDALMMVDLAALPPVVLQRYLGKAGAEAFRAHHRSQQSLGEGEAGLIESC